MSHAAAFRKLLAGPDVIVAPGMYDGMTALLVEQAGFACAYLSGASISFSRIAQPDIGLMSLTEVGEAVANIRERLKIPFIVDCDTGFGNALNTQRTVRMVERMGASGIQLEDQSYPKRCGHLAGKSVVPTAEMVGKLKAALDARQDPNTVIIARTDAIGVEGFDAALARAHAYMEAGADVLFVEAPQTEEQQIVLGKTFAGKVPLLANMVEGGRTPMKSAAELHKIGFKIVIFPGAMMRVITFAATEYLKTLKTYGETTRIRDRMFDFNGLNAILGTNEIVAGATRYDANLKKAAE